MPGSAPHLFHRFFDVLLARPLTEAERGAVEAWLTPQLAWLFFAQPIADQRHGFEAACVVATLGDDGDDAIVAALTHDVAKRHSRLGVIGRSVASVLIKMRARLSTRMATYRDHGLIGARELAEAGAPGLAIDFAMHHQGERPPSIPAQTWELLVRADQPPKAWASIRGRITSRQR